MLSKRVEFAAGWSIGGGSKRDNRDIEKRLRDGVFSDTSALRLSSAADPAKAVIQVFNRTMWDESRKYRASVLSGARQELAKLSS